MPMRGAALWNAAMPSRRATHSSARCSSLRTSRLRGGCSNRSPRADPRQYCAQSADVLLALVPRNHKARRARVLRAPVVKLKAGLAHLALARIAKADEDFIGFDGRQKAPGGGSADALRHLIGALRIAPPQS